MHVVPTTTRWLVALAPCLGRVFLAARRWAVRAVIVGFALVFVVGVFIRHGADILVGAPPTDEAGSGVPAGRLQGSASISIGDEVGHGIDAPPGTVALTFDDGPDPVYTDQILEILERNDVRATFFVIGKEVLDHPDAAKRIVEAGHELGNHTQLHYEMGGLSARQIRAQLDLAQVAVVSATGVSTSLYRAPYSGPIDTLSDAELAAAVTVQRHGYYVVGTDITPRDYDPSVSVGQLLLDSLPPVGEGAVITLHDGGGDRSATVELLEQLITQLRTAGYEFVTIGDLVADATGVSPIDAADRWLGVRAATVGTALTITGWIETSAIAVVVVFMALFVLRIALLIVFALIDHWRSAEPEVARVSERVTVIVPAYNEKVGIAASLRSIDASDYPNLEILVVDDGSSDATAEIATSLGLERVRVLTKPNGGKASALNHGILNATSDIIVMVDGDTLIEPETVSRIVAPFSDPQVGAVAGNPKIGNAGNLITRLQVGEYLIASSLERRLLGVVGMITTVPGAIGAWRRSAVQEAGFVSSQTFAEDTDLTIAIARGGWKVSYVPDSRAWTEAPTTWSAFYRQRSRWTFGTLQVLWKQRRGFFDRGAGSQVGRIAMPYMFLSGYLLGALGPLVDLVLVANLYLGSWRLALMSWGVMSSLGVVTGLVAAKLDGDRLRVALVIPLQQLAYRPIMHVITLASLRRAALGERQVWGAQQRVGGLSVGAVKP